MSRASAMVTAAHKRWDGSPVTTIAAASAWAHWACVNGRSRIPPNNQRRLVVVVVPASCSPVPCMVLEARLLVLPCILLSQGMAKLEESRQLQLCGKHTALNLHV